MAHMEWTEGLVTRSGTGLGDGTCEKKKRNTENIQNIVNTNEYMCPSEKVVNAGPDD